MKKLFKISSIIILVLILVLVLAIYFYAFGFSTKEYRNNFISFNYPSAYSITTETIINSHEMRDGKDLYGTTYLTLENNFGQRIDISSLRYGSVKDLWSNQITEKQNAFESKYKETAADLFEVFTNTTIPGYREKLSFFVEEKDDMTIGRSGRVSVGFYGKAATTADISSSPSNAMEAKFFESQAMHFADIFKDSFTEVE